MAIGIFAVVTTLILSTFVYYQLFVRQVFEDLKSYTLLIAGADASLPEAIKRIPADNIRITLLDDEDNVVFDNAADYISMENHGDRAEIIEARSYGEGSEMRMSKTMLKNTFYYALLMDDDNVLRVSKDAYSIGVIFYSAIPVLIVIALIIIVVCAVIAKYLTIKLVLPIEKMAENLDGDSRIEVYEEYEPIFRSIKENHNKTLSNAKMRQEFTANVSHELKTPLTAISGYAELLESGMATGDDVTKFSREIHKNANRLLTLINDTIRLSELDDTARSANDILEEIDLEQVVNGCKDALLVSANKHGIKINFTTSPCPVKANKGMMEEILFNLCDNAIRYNNEGGSVFVSVYTDDENKILSVKDTGIGIPKEHQDRIFERFYRVDKSRSKSTGGTGLGLAIVKHMVIKQKAKLELYSEEGMGTEIRVVFQ